MLKKDALVYPFKQYGQFVRSPFPHTTSARGLAGGVSNRDGGGGGSGPKDKPDTGGGKTYLPMPYASFHEI
jgi:hypothetical protein